MSQLSELLPVPDEASRPFFDAALEGRLLLQRCAGCAQAWFPFRARCAACNQGSLAWEVASGKGRIYMHGRMHQIFHPELAEAVPYRLAIVELEEGVRFLTQLVDAEPERVRTGAPVEVIFERLSEQVAIPKFRLR
ncbi:MAG: OB-fold domain-containing protein [Myxococcales bacterium]|nr:OB-fold domain-containing protein [Myxococcales bacterium]